jgi:ATP-binding cassette subfamily C protein
LVDAALLAGWRDGIAYVPQDGFLFHDTVRRNLTWHDETIDQARIDAAIRLAGAEALIAALPLGLETIIGERGAMLSGGERQRIALTRALIRNPRLLILDEAANAIDAEGEAALLDRLAALDPRPTILMISHRAESVALCDRIISVERGIMTAT